MRKTTKEILEVNSKAISVVTYQKDIKQLSIQFRNGRIYLYKNVPLKVYDRLRTNKSVGVYYNSTIRKKYEFELL
jgi:hypothetical protein